MASFSLRTQTLGATLPFAWFLFLAPGGRRQFADVRHRYTDFGSVGSGDIPPIRGGLQVGGRGFF